MLGLQPSMLQFMGSQRVGPDLTTEQQQQQQHISLFCNSTHQKTYENKFIFQVMKFYSSDVLCLHPTKQKSLNGDVRI